MSSSYLHGSDFSTRQTKLAYIQPPEWWSDSPVHQDLRVQDKSNAGTVLSVSSTAKPEFTPLWDSFLLCFPHRRQAGIVLHTSVSPVVITA